MIKVGFDIRVDLGGVIKILGNISVNLIKMFKGFIDVIRSIENDSGPTFISFFDGNVMVLREILEGLDFRWCDVGGDGSGWEGLGVEGVDKCMNLGVVRDGWDPVRWGVVGWYGVGGVAEEI